MKINQKKLKNTILHAYGFKIESLTPLSGFYDINYKVTCGNNSYFLKIFGFDTLPVILFQLDLMSKCYEAGLPVAKILLTTKKKLLFKIGKSYGMLQEFLPGKQLRSIPLNVSILEEVGVMLGRVHAFTSQRKFAGKAWKKYPWDLSQFHLIVKDYQKAKKYLEPEIATLVKRVFFAWKKHKLALEKMRKGPTHNDYHGGNILIAGRRCTGIVDFGDAMDAWYAADVAIALAHLCFNGTKNPDPFMKAFLRGYKKYFQLNTQELRNLPLLIQMRAASSLVEIPLQLNPAHFHELYDEMTRSNKRVLQYFQKQNRD